MTNEMDRALGDLIPKGIPTGAKRQVKEAAKTAELDEVTAKRLRSVIRDFLIDAKTALDERLDEEKALEQKVAKLINRLKAEGKIDDRKMIIATSVTERAAARSALWYTTWQDWERRLGVMHRNNAALHTRMSEISKVWSDPEQKITEILNVLRSAAGMRRYSFEADRLGLWFIMWTRPVIVTERDPSDNNLHRRYNLGCYKVRIPLWPGANPNAIDYIPVDAEDKPYETPGQMRVPRHPHHRGRDSSEPYSQGNSYGVSEGNPNGNWTCLGEYLVSFQRALETLDFSKLVIWVHTFLHSINEHSYLNRPGAYHTYDGRVIKSDMHWVIEMPGVP